MATTEKEKHKIVYTIQMLFKDVKDKEKHIQALYLDLKNNKNLFGASDVWVEDIEDWGLNERTV